MATSLLEKTRKINRLLQRSESVEYNDISRVLSAVLDANVYITTEKERKYYLSEIKKDITYYKRTYAKITNKFDMNGDAPKIVTERLAKYIEDIKNGIEPIKDENKDEIIMGFKVYRG